MSQYIVCLKKRNKPRMDIRICIARCAIKDDCEEIQVYINRQKVADQIFSNLEQSLGPEAYGVLEGMEERHGKQG